MQAHNLIGEIEDPQLTLQYKACYARICDSKRKFLEAATHYYDLSQSGPGVQCVFHAIISVVESCGKALDRMGNRKYEILHVSTASKI